MTPDERRVDREARVARTLRLFREACERHGFFITGDQRIRLPDAAQLLGLSPKGLARLREERKGPPSYARGVRGAPVTFRLDDLAAWVESQREQD